MRIIRAAHHRVMPWKNGGGVTREVLAAPDPDDPSQFLWRISIATVAQAGPFSRFPGIDRSIAVLDGAGMRLHVDGKPATVSRGGTPFRFSGDADVSSELIAGETMDLNVMTRRGRFDHAMRRIDCTTTFVVDASLTVLIASTPVRITLETRTVDLNRFDALTDISSGECYCFEAERACDVFAIGLEPIAP